MGCLGTCIWAMDFLGETWGKACDIVEGVTNCSSDQDICKLGCDAQFNETVRSIKVQWDPEQQRAQCWAECDRTQSSNYTRERCEVDLKVNADCTCTGNTTDSCDCTDSPFGLAESFWKIGCLTLGSCGFLGSTLMTGIPGLLSTYRKMRCCNIHFYSVFCGIFCWVLLATGGVFLVIALTFKVGPGKEYLDDCEKAVGNLVNSTGTQDCGLTSFCNGMRTLSDEAFLRAACIAGSFLLSGITMFFGMFACCCCKASLPGQSNNRVSATDFMQEVSNNSRQLVRSSSGMLYMGANGARTLGRSFSRSMLGGSSGTEPPRNPMSRSWSFMGGKPGDDNYRPGLERASTGR